VTANAGSLGWSLPLHRSLCGASHQRRGLPCQDASLSASVRSADGQAIGLMAVADGHGGSRYWLSDVGSRLACELAIALASQDLSTQPMSGSDAQSLDAIRHWLSTELPPRLVSRWQTAIRADWQSRSLPPEHCREGFSSQTYGTTLALVVLTPRWWAHTGLGDWDLVLLSNTQADRIISEETLPGLQAEATESLCQSNAELRFAARTGVHSLTGDQCQACGVVLSTDGIRKSCASDADHLALCRYLLQEAQLQQTRTATEASNLDPSLERISREGSGDDVSVALAGFGCLAPERETSAPAAPPPLPALTLDRVASRDPQPPPSGLGSPRLRRAERRGQRRRLALGVLLAAGLGSTAVLAWRQTTRPSAAEAPMRWSAEDQPELRQLISDLCRQPQLIEPRLSARQQQFEQLRRHPAALEAWRQHQDWLGVLIGLSRPGQPVFKPLQSCHALAAALERRWQPLSNAKPKPQNKAPHP